MKCVHKWQDKVRTGQVLSSNTLGRIPMEKFNKSHWEKFVWGKEKLGLIFLLVKLGKQLGFLFAN